ncbi:unnamed protein product [Amoebophrya sp. A25]|nr:unnamed protein product [Amoebophrya sp. A25]|eukprot:GSA25T00015845001.1
MAREARSAYMNWRWLSLRRPCCVLFYLFSIKINIDRLFTGWVESVLGIGCLCFLAERRARALLLHFVA